LRHVVRAGAEKLVRPAAADVRTSGQRFRRLLLRRLS